MRSPGTPASAASPDRPPSPATATAGPSLPAPAEAGALLTRLGLSDADRDDTLAARPDPDRDPQVWQVIERCHAALVRGMGTVGKIDPWPALPPGTGAPGRFAHVWALVATVGAVRDYHRSRGIPDEVSWAALAVLGAQMADHRALHCEGGLHTQDWLTFHYRGAVYPLGRLHFERLRVWFDDPDGGPDAPRRGDAGIGLHIPAGHLPPAQVDDALDLARAFFARHFPDEAPRVATCVSWLLDDQLARYLAPETNILAFQRRFRLLPPGDTDDSATMVEFLFHRPLSELDSLPRGTTLQRAVVDHIRAGHPWRFRTGWFPW